MTIDEAKQLADLSIDDARAQLVGVCVRWLKACLDMYKVLSSPASQLVAALQANPSGLVSALSRIQAADGAEPQA